ncbi:hypothetical protein H2203_005572 [Taxawa tesnikishii (nom. ined.)]|nr:hypothetical protein H2203_005572 [Dothideales sp. JES 119]
MSLSNSAPRFARQCARQLRTSCQYARSFSTTTRRTEDRAPARTAFTDLMKTLDKPRQSQRTPPPRTASPRTLPPRASTPGGAGGPGSLTDIVKGQIQSASDASRRRAASPQVMAEVERATMRADLERQMTRRWKAGDVYAPHDLSGVEMSKWRQNQRKGRPQKDVFDLLAINPIDQYKNFAMMSEYMSEMGRIKHSNDTGLRPVNQRRMAKAVRRAIGLGLMPSVHRHPEILRMEGGNRR